MMSRVLLAAALLAVQAGAGAASTTPERGVATGQHSAEAETVIDDGLHGILELLYSSHLAEAEARAVALVEAAPDDPRVHILHARVLRESFPDQNADHESMRRRAAPIHAACERAIAAADRLLERDSDSVPGHLYRGWAHFFRAQIHALADQYWSAGRQAKKGKSDLDAALAVEPGLADAHGVLGTYLYFADILPGVVKFARTLVGVPGGDRDRGLQGLETAARNPGYNQIDAQALLGVIHFAFEGDFEASARYFAPLLERFDTNPRLREPIAVLDILRPDAVASALEQTARVADLHAASSEPWNRQMSYRLRLYQALGEIVQGRFDSAQVHLDVVHRAAPEEPDWLRRDVALALADLHLLAGESREAAALHAAEPDRALRDRLRYVLDDDAAATAPEAERWRRLQTLARDLYTGNTGTVRGDLEALAATDDPLVHFYLGDLALLLGDADAAAVHFERLTELPLPARMRLYKFLAYERLAGIRARSGDKREAERVLERALAYYQDRDLLRHVVRARHRYYALGRVGARPAAERAHAGQALGEP